MEGKVRGRSQDPVTHTRAQVNKLILNSFTDSQPITATPTQNMLQCKQLANNYHFKKSVIYMYTKKGCFLLCFYDILYSRLFNSTNLFFRESKWRLGHLGSVHALL